MGIPQVATMKVNAPATRSKISSKTMQIANAVMTSIMRYLLYS